MKPYVALFACVFSMTIAAQQPAAPDTPRSAVPTSAPAPKASVPSPDPSAGGQSVNIRLDVSVSDQREGAVAQPKTLMVILADKAMGQTRAAFEDRTIKVDARPTIVEGLIRVSVTVNSAEPPRLMLVGEPGQQPDPLLNWTNSFALLLPSGKPMVALETTDPVTKRKMSIEVKATILK